MLALPVRPSLVAVMVAVPELSALTKPVAETLATAAFELAQATSRSVNKIPEESRSAAIN